MKHWSEKLVKLHACIEAIEWVATQKSLAIAWKNCERGDWMLWLLAVKGKTNKTHRRIVTAACQCARLALRFVPANEVRPLKAIEAAEAWTENPTQTMAAWAAGAAEAARAAARAAEAAGAAARAARAAAEAAWAAGAAGAAGAAEDKKCADIVRKYFPAAPKL